MVFTGIVRELGFIKKIERNDSITVYISCSESVKGLNIGDSVCVNGVCLTAVSVSNNMFSVQLGTETLKITTFGTNLLEGAYVNLEMALKESERNSGHNVTGHVDCSASLLQKRFVENNNSHQLVYSVPSAFSKYLQQKDYIAVNGVSLTINEVHGSEFTVCIIPHTWEHTNLKHSKQVNIEFNLSTKIQKDTLLLSSAQCKEETKLYDSSLKHIYQTQIDTDPTFGFNKSDLVKAKTYRICIITTDWNKEVVDAMKQGAIDIIQKNFHNSNTKTMTCPGSKELPFVAKSAALSKQFDAIIVLGCLITGKTSHAAVISQACIHSVMKVELETGVPVVFGILTDVSQEQALERAGLLSGSHNSGRDYGLAAIKMCKFNFQQKTLMSKL